MKAGKKSDSPQKKGAIVITGASRGLGKAIALEAAHLGFPLALLARSRSDLEKAKSEIQRKTKTKKEISVHRVDLTQKMEVDQTISEVLREHGRVCALVNNAATWVAGSLSQLTPEDILNSLNLNFFSAFHATQALLKQRKKGDLALVNVGATASLQGWPEALPFCLGKGALRMYSQALAREFGPQGVHVAHLIVDGLLDNPRTRALNPQTPDHQFIHQDSVAKSVLSVIQQDPSAWTFEWDVRPYCESF